MAEQTGRFTPPHAPGATTVVDRPWADTIRARVEESVEVTRALLDDELVSGLEAVALMIADALAAGGKVILFGNGGSAADATHLAAELVGRYKLDRAPLPALSLTDNAASLSAIGNDYAYEDVFARQVRAFGRPGDVAVGLTTSGTSANVVAGLAAAREGAMRTVSITGETGGECAAGVDVCLRMPAADTARVQECTMLVGHTICELVERTLFA
jgi:D-sedoheptulose 7-phosphate isomerase